MIAAGRGWKKKDALLGERRNGSRRLGESGVEAGRGFVKFLLMGTHILELERECVCEMGIGFLFLCHHFHG